MCISNSGLSDKTKVNIKQRPQKTEKLVSRNPLLLIHFTVGGN